MFMYDFRVKLTHDKNIFSTRSVYFLAFIIHGKIELRVTCWKFRESYLRYVESEKYLHSFSNNLLAIAGLSRTNKFVTRISPQIPLVLDSLAITNTNYWRDENTGRYLFDLT